MVGVTTLVVLLNAGRWTLEGAYVLAFLLTLWWVLQVTCDWMDRKRFSIAAFLLFALLAVTLAIFSPVLLSANKVFVK